MSETDGHSSGIQINGNDGIDTEGDASIHNSAILSSTDRTVHRRTKTRNATRILKVII